MGGIAPLLLVWAAAARRFAALAQQQWYAGWRFAWASGSRLGSRAEPGSGKGRGQRAREVRGTDLRGRASLRAYSDLKILYLCPCPLPFALKGTAALCYLPLTPILRLGRLRRLRIKSWPKKDRRLLIIRSICFNCESACGERRMSKETLGSEDRQSCSSGSRRTSEGRRTPSLEDPDRVPYPLERAGAVRASGSASRDEALDELAPHPKAIVEGQRLMCTSDARRVREPWCSRGASTDITATPTHARRRTSRALPVDGRRSAVARITRMPGRSALVTSVGHTSIPRNESSRASRGRAIDCDRPAPVEDAGERIGGSGKSRHREALILGVARHLLITGSTTVPVRRWVGMY
jgi:hypothetical protein